MSTHGKLFVVCSLGIDLSTVSELLLLEAHTSLHYKMVELGLVVMIR